MIRPDVVEYLRENLSKHPVEALRRQLQEEGVSDVDFEECLGDALRGHKTLPSTRKNKPKSKIALFLLVGGVVLLLGVAFFALSRKNSPPPAAEAAAPSAGESGYVGAAGWVVRLPKDYVGLSEFKDSSKTDETVHFCKRGTDPTNFLDEGLYGQLGIVRLEVAPSEFPANMTGAASLSNAVTRKITAQGEKFVLKNIQIGTLPGVQVNVQSPFPRVEAYILGQSELYFFSGGQEDDVWRDIVLSLRDAHSEE